LKLKWRAPFPKYNRLLKSTVAASEFEIAVNKIYRCGCKSGASFWTLKFYGKTCTLLVTRFGFFEITRDNIETSKAVNEINGSATIAKGN
jgi:hypothetical protein